MSVVSGGRRCCRRGPGRHLGLIVEGDVGCRAAGCWVKASLCRRADGDLDVLLTVDVRPEAVAVRVYEPTRSILQPAKEATPATAASGFVVHAKVAPAAVVSASVTAFVLLVDGVATEILDRHLRLGRERRAARRGARLLREAEPDAVPTEITKLLLVPDVARMRSPSACRFGEVDLAAGEGRDPGDRRHRVGRAAERRAARRRQRERDGARRRVTVLPPRSWIATFGCVAAAVLRRSSRLLREPELRCGSDRDREAAARRRVRLPSVAVNVYVPARSTLHPANEQPRDRRQWVRGAAERCSGRCGERERDGAHVCRDGVPAEILDRHLRLRARARRRRSTRSAAA